MPDRSEYREVVDLLGHIAGELSQRDQFGAVAGPELEQRADLQVVGDPVQQQVAGAVALAHSRAGDHQRLAVRDPQCLGRCDKSDLIGRKSGLQRQAQLRGRCHTSHPVRRVGGEHDLSRRHQGEQRRQVLGYPPGGVEQHVWKVHARAPDPSQVGDGGVGEDHPRVGVLLRIIDHVPTECRDPAAGVDQDRQRALICKREQLLHVGVVERELLSARMQLYSLSAAGRARVRPRPARWSPVSHGRRHQQAVALGCHLDHEVVRRPIAVGLVHGEDEATTGMRAMQAAKQLVGGLTHAVRIVLPEVGVGVEQLQSRYLITNRLQPGVEDGAQIHTGIRTMNTMDTTRTQPRSLNEPWELGGVTIPNRVVLAPLAGIGNWFVRLQAKRYGAGLTVSEMVSSHAVHYGNERTCTELLRIHPDEHPVSVQLFGADPDVMASAAERVAAAGADLIDINMGCPVPKVCKTGAGAALLEDPDRAVAVALAAAKGSGLPVTVKLRTGLRPGDGKGVALARDLAERGAVAGLSIHPRHASQRHSGKPDYELAAQMVEELPVPVLLSGGLRSAELARDAFERTGADAILLARGSLGNPWVFERLMGRRSGEPTRQEIVTELNWVLDCAIEHMGAERANRYLRKFYPWYIERLGGTRGEQAALQAALQQADTIEHARELFADSGSALAGVGSGF